jgi:hypothetical protein
MSMLKKYNRGMWVVATGGIMVGGVALLALDRHAADPVECGNAARIVANRSHAMFETATFLQVRDQAYRICLADPAAFRRILR